MPIRVINCTKQVTQEEKKALEKQATLSVHFLSKKA